MKKLTVHEYVIILRGLQKTLSMTSVEIESVAAQINKAKNIRLEDAESLLETLEDIQAAMNLAKKGFNTVSGTQCFAGCRNNTLNQNFQYSPRKKQAFPSTGQLIFCEECNNAHSKSQDCDSSPEHRADEEE